MRPDRLHDPCALVQVDDHGEIGPVALQALPGDLARVGKIVVSEDLHVKLRVPVVLNLVGHGAGA
jgi:hypothetical protein